VCSASDLPGGTSRSPLPRTLPPEENRIGRLLTAHHKLFRYQEFLERAKGLEPSTPTLARSCSCFNALPRVIGAVYKKRAGYSADITMTQ